MSHFWPIQDLSMFLRRKKRNRRCELERRTGRSNGQTGMRGGGALCTIRANITFHFQRTRIPHNDVLSTPYSVVKLGAKVVASRSFGEHTTRRCATVRDGRTSERRDERAMDSDERRKDVRRSDVHPSTISRSFINIFFS